jgi:uncharacterized membrane protein
VPSGASTAIIMSSTRHWPKPIRIIRARPRLFISAVIGLLVIAACPADWRITTRLIAGWDVGVVLYLALALHMMLTADVHDIRRRSRLQDEGQTTILALTATAALASLGAIIALLGSSGAAGHSPTNLTLATVTILLSWAFTHTMFALHYAHEFYDIEGKAGGLKFPGDPEELDYRDFIYFSFVIGMTAQVADVGVTSKPIRHTVLAHGIISFIFNAALLALAVNIAASAI